jgi:hypothetical protein
MVYLAISPQGLTEALSTAKLTGHSVWCGCDAISDAEYQQNELKNLSRFIYPLQNAEPSELEGALATIAEHHPNETIWVESRTEASQETPPN